MRSRDWSSDVGSSDRSVLADEPGPVDPAPVVADDHHREADEAGAADALEQPQHEKHLEGGRQRRQEPEQPEGSEAGHEHGSASVAGGPEPADRCHDDAVDRTRGVSGKMVSVRVDIAGPRIIYK